jgi:hypothetical protein
MILHYSAAPIRHPCRSCQRSLPSSSTPSTITVIRDEVVMPVVSSFHSITWTTRRPNLDNNVKARPREMVTTSFSNTQNLNFSNLSPNKVITHFVIGRSPLLTACWRRCNHAKPQKSQLQHTSLQICDRGSLTPGYNPTSHSTNAISAGLWRQIPTSGPTEYALV